MKITFGYLTFKKWRKLPDSCATLCRVLAKHDLHVVDRKSSQEQHNEVGHEESTWNSTTK